MIRNFREWKKRFTFNSTKGTENMLINIVKFLQSVMTTNRCFGTGGSPYCKQDRNLGALALPQFLGIEDLIYSIKPHADAALKVDNLKM